MSLNKQFKECCQPNIDLKIEKIDDEIYKVKNFFSNPNQSSNFFKSLQRWDCDELSLSSKSGMECFLPSWSSSYLMKSFLKNNNFSVSHENNCIINFHYYGMKKKNSIVI